MEIYEIRPEIEANVHYWVLLEDIRIAFMKDGSVEANLDDGLATYIRQQEIWERVL